MNNDELIKSLQSLERKIDSMNQPVIRSKREAARYLKIGREKFDLLLRRGVLPVHRDFGGMYFLKNELLEYLRTDKLKIVYKVA